MANVDTSDYIRQKRLITNTNDIRLLDPRKFRKTGLAPSFIDLTNFTRGSTHSTMAAKQYGATKVNRV